MENKRPTEPEDWRFLWQESDEDIRFFKRQQWTLTYYLFLLFVGIVGAVSLMKTGGSFFSCLLLIVVFIVGVASLYILYSLDTAIKNARERVNRAKSHMPKEIAEENGKEKRIHVVQFLAGVQMIAIIGTVLVIISIT